MTRISGHLDVDVCLKKFRSWPNSEIVFPAKKDHKDSA